MTQLKIILIKHFYSNISANRNLKMTDTIYTLTEQGTKTEIKYEPNNLTDNKHISLSTD